MIECPAPKDVIDGFPRWKASRQITPGDAAFDDIQHGVQNSSQIGGWPTALGTLGQHRFEIFPLSIGEAGIVYGVFHASTEAPLKIGLASAKPNVNHSFHFFDKPTQI